MIEQDFSRKAESLHAPRRFRAASVELFRHHAPCRTNTTTSRPQSRAVLSVRYQVQHSLLLLWLVAGVAVQDAIRTLLSIVARCSSWDGDARGLKCGSTIVTLGLLLSSTTYDMHDREMASKHRISTSPRGAIPVARKGGSTSLIVPANSTLLYRRGRLLRHPCNNAC